MPNSKRPVSTGTHMGLSYNNVQTDNQMGYSYSSTNTKTQMGYDYSGIEADNQMGYDYGYGDKKASVDKGFNDTVAEAFTSEQAKKLLESATGVPSERLATPPIYEDYITYEHRIHDDTNTVRIGDCHLVIPPDFISVKEIRNTEQTVSLRQESTLKDQHGYSRKEITMTIFFNGKDQINGYEVESPFDYPYYVDGIRPLLAQFKCTPFLPVVNDFLNETNDIWNLALQSITVNTVQGFPDVLQATIIAHEFNAEPYIEVPNYLLGDSIDWDLFRYYYQQLLKDNDSRKNIKERLLKKSNVKVKDTEEITISVLDMEKLLGNDFNEKIEITDDLFIKTITNHGENKEDFVITDLSFGLSNMLTFLQLSAHDSPTMQYIGGSDTIISMNIETTSESAAKAFQELSKESKKVTLSSRGQEGFGVLKVENDILNIIGGQYLMMESCMIATSPDFPGKYNIYIECVSYDMRTRSREDLEGFRPFPENRNGSLSDSIFKSAVGLKNKILQDAEAEKRIQEIESYPDLFLPLYREVDEALVKIRAFRSKHKLEPSPFAGEYPRRTSTQGLGGKKIYDKFVDPDFYINYPYDYNSIEDVLEIGDPPKPKADAVDVEITYEVSETRIGNDNSYVSSGNPGTYVKGYDTLSYGRKKMLGYLLGEVGKGYVYGAVGQVLTDNLISKFKRDYPSINKGIDKWKGKIVYDCSGFISWGLWKAGVHDKFIRATSATLVTSRFSTAIDKSSLLPGDLLYKPGHVAIYIGDGKTVEAANVSAGVITSTMGNRFTQYRRLKGLDDIRGQGSTSDYYVGSTGNVLSSDGAGTGKVYQTAQKGKIGKFGNEKLDQYDTLILRYAKKYDLEPNWMKALMKQESNMNPNSINSLPAVGLMQLTRSVFKDKDETFNVEKCKNPEFNISNGFEYAKKCLDMLDGNYEHMVQGYNMGPYGFKSYLRGERSLPKETQTHIKKIKEYYAQLQSNIGEAMYGGVEYAGTNQVSSVSSVVIRKKHGEKEKDFDGEFGEPLYFESPVNYLVNNLRNGLGIAEGIREVSSGAISEKLVTALLYDGLFRKEVKEKWAPKYSGYAIDDIMNTIDKKELTEIIDSSIVNPSHADMMIDLMNFYVTYYKKDEPEEPEVEYATETYKVQVNKGRSNNEGLISRMTVDMKNYGKKRTMLRAFPTYVFAIVDESADWLDGRKLWSNYYTYRSVVDIQVHQEKDQPVHTAILTVTNTNKNLETTPKEHLFKKGIEDDEEYNKVVRWIFKNTGIFIGGAKVTQQAVDEKNKLISSAKLEPGTRIHIRMGYGSNPSELPVVFNGTVTDMSVGHMIRMVAQSDGIELINSIVSSKKDETNDIWMLQKEGSDIVASLLLDRDNLLMNAINSEWGEKNRYGIEHFGNSTIEGIAVLETRKLEYDLCKNIYLSKYKQDLFCGPNVIANADGEKNVEMFLYNKTPWDVAQIASQTLPEFICQPMYHQFDSRLFYGLPTWDAKYRYEVEEGTGKIFEYAKSFSQFHLIDSVGDIIDNKVKCTENKLYTNVIAMYSVGSDFRSTPILYADKNIEWGKQKTKVVDTTLVQNYLGPDDLWTALFFPKAGKMNAINVGIRNLIDSFERMYDDEIIIVGNTSIKPLDYIMISDLYAEMSGMALVRSVTHSFSMNTGLTTSVIPGLVTYSKTKDAGSSNIFNSLIGLGLSASGVAFTRMAALKVSKKLGFLYRNIKQYKMYRDARDLAKKIKSAKVVTDGVTFAITKGKALLEVAKVSNKAEKIAKIKTFITAVSANKALLLSSVYGAVLYVSITVILNSIIESITDYFSYNNCIGIKPLTHRGKHFVTNVKGQKKLIDGGNDGSSANIMKEDEQAIFELTNLSSGDGSGGGFSEGTSDGGGGNGGGGAF